MSGWEVSRQASGWPAPAVLTVATLKLWRSEQARRRRRERRLFPINLTVRETLGQSLGDVGEVGTSFLGYSG